MFADLYCLNLDGIVAKESPDFIVMNADRLQQRFSVLVN